MNHDRVNQIINSYEQRNPPFRVKFIDTGFCKIVYKGKNRYGEWIFYAICQEAPKSFKIYRVCQKYEPQNTVQVYKPLYQIFQLPDPRKGQLCKDVREFILEQSINHPDFV